MMDVIKKLLKYFKSPIQVFNDTGERIESMRFSVPALRVGVLEYGPGQLQTGNAALDGKPVRLYYPPEAVSDEKFLKSLETAPVVVGGHDSTTNEQNKKIDGWAHSVFYDAAANAAMIAGVVKGAKEVAYIKGNLGAAGFGASAFVDIYDLKVENGVAPNGQEYNAIANDLRATHVALAPHVRDPENKIKVINAVCVKNTGEIICTGVKNMKIRASEIKANDVRGIMRELENRSDIMNYIRSHALRGGDFLEAVASQIAEDRDVDLDTIARGMNIKNNEVQSMDPKEIAALVKNAVEEAMAEKNTGDRMDAMEETLKQHGDALNEINEKLTPKKEGEGENAEGEGKEEKEEKKGATLENAKPSQEMVKAFSTAMNVDFGGKTPSFEALAALAGIKETDPAARIAAVNAKFGEMQSTEPKEKEAAAAQNAAGEVF